MEAGTGGGVESGGGVAVAGGEEVMFVDNSNETQPANAIALPHNIPASTMNMKTRKAVQISISGVDSASFIAGEGMDSVQVSISISNLKGQSFTLDCTAMTTETENSLGGENNNTMVPLGEGKINPSDGSTMHGGRISSGGGGKTH